MRELPCINESGVSAGQTGFVDYAHARVLDVLWRLDPCRFPASIFVATTGNHPGLDKEALQAMAARRVDGIVRVPSGPTAATQSPVPVVELNRYSGRQVPAVVSDDINGVKQLTELAVTAGYTDIAAIVGPETYSTSRDRLAGFKAAAEAAGFEEGSTAAKRFRIISSDFSVVRGSEAMTTLLSKPPQAVLPLSSRLVMGVLKTARAHGIRFPDDMALAGYGDPDWFEIWGPGITTFAPPLREMGAKQQKHCSTASTAKTTPHQ